MKTIYYYQTFIGLSDVLQDENRSVDVIIVSAIHFGKNEDGSAYIHLNDHDPNDSLFDQVWLETKELNSVGVKIMIMLGGAGGAYDWLFQNGDNFSIYYQMLKDMIMKYPQISGIDLDIEEEVNIDDVKNLIRQLRIDFGNTFTITMAPVIDSLIFNEVGLGGFVYKDLYQSEEGKEIGWFNVQAYSQGDFSLDIFEEMIENGFPANQLVMGMISSEYPTINDMKRFVKDLMIIEEKYPMIMGVFNWEYFDAPPNSKDPIKWAQMIKKNEV